MPTLTGWSTHNDSVLRDIADCLAPLHTLRRPVSRYAPWFDGVEADCRDARRDCRRSERRYQLTYGVADRRQWVEATRRCFQLYRSKEEAY